MTVGSTTQQAGGGRFPSVEPGRGATRGWAAWLAVAAALVAAALVATPAPAAAQQPHEKAFADLIAPWAARAKEKNPAKATKELEPVWSSFEEARGIVLLTEGDPQYKANVKKRDEQAKKVLPLLEEVVALSQGKDGLPVEQRQELLVRLVELELEAGANAPAAVAAEYFARAYPEHENAISLAGAANAALIRQMNAPGLDDAKKAAIRKQVVQINEYIAEKWPKEEAAKDARSRLAQLALASGDANQALEIARKLPETSPQRAEIQLQMGLLQWSDYLKASKLPAGDAKRPSDAELEKKRLATKKTLEDGVGLIRKHGTGDPSYVMLTSELALAQLELELGDAKAALAILQRPKTGLLDLVMSNSPIVQGNNMPQQVYGSALRAFLQTQNFDQAETMMERISGVSGDPSKVLGLRLSLARQLDKELEEAQKQGADGKAIAEKAKGLGGLLKKISTNASALDFGNAAWVALKQFEQAKAIDPEGVLAPNDDTADAFKAYSSALAMYQALLARTEGKPAESTEGKSRTGIRLQIAKCQRRIGEYKEAIAAFEDILQTAPKNIDAQVEAAKTYQDWAESSGDRQYWKYAMAGGPVRKTSSGDKESAIMGWGRIGLEIRSPDGKNGKEFYNSRYNLELSRAKSAAGAPEAEARELLETSEQSLLRLYSVRPELAEGALKARFEPLLVALQKRLGKDATGFPSREALAAMKNQPQTPSKAVEVKKRPAGLPASSYTVLIIAGVALVLALVASYFVYQRSQNKAPAPRKPSSNFQI